MEKTEALEILIGSIGSYGASVGRVVDIVANETDDEDNLDRAEVFLAMSQALLSAMMYGAELGSFAQENGDADRLECIKLFTSRVAAYMLAATEMMLHCYHDGTLRLYMDTVHEGEDIMLMLFGHLDEIGREELAGAIADALRDDEGDILESLRKAKEGSDD